MSDAGDDDDVGGDEYDEYEIEDEDNEDIDEVTPELKRFYKQHPETKLDYIEKIYPKLNYTGEDDPNHKTNPMLSRNEKTKIIGLRANALSKGAPPFIKVPPHITDVKEIARLELEKRRLSYFIISRTLPNGDCEYWRLNDLLW